MSDDFSTNQSITYWLFTDMLQKETLFEFVEAKKIAGKSGVEFPGLILLGEAKTGDGKDIAGEFQSSVYNLQPDKELKDKYPSWKDMPSGVRLLLTPNKSRIKVKLFEEPTPSA